MAKEKTRRAVRVEDRSGPWGKNDLPIYSEEQVKTILESPEELRFGGDVRAMVDELGELLDVNGKMIVENQDLGSRVYRASRASAYLDQKVAKTVGDRVVAYLDSLPEDKQAEAEEAIKHAIVLGARQPADRLRSAEPLALERLQDERQATSYCDTKEDIQDSAENCVVQKLFDETKTGRVSNEAALKRVSAQLSARHGIKASAKTLRRELLGKKDNA